LKNKSILKWSASASSSGFIEVIFLDASWHRSNASSMLGGNSEEVTPVPMPNTEVKLFSADGSWGLSPCESRTPPGTHKKSSKKAALFCLRRNHKVS
jgi:hypothetical protein